MLLSGEVWERCWLLHKTLCPVPHSWHGNHRVTQRGTAEVCLMGTGSSSCIPVRAAMAPRRQQSLEPPGSNQWETGKCLQTCQGWRETLPSLGIGATGRAEGGRYMRRVFSAHLLASPLARGRTRPAPTSAGSGALCLSNGWMEFLRQGRQGHTCCQEATSVNHSSATGVWGGKPQTGVGTFPGLESVAKQLQAEIPHKNWGTMNFSRV